MTAELLARLPDLLDGGDVQLTRFDAEVIRSDGSQRTSLLFELDLR